MDFVKIWAIVRNILPTKRIGAWIVGVLAAIVALVMGVKNTELKDAFCSAPVVELPKIEVQPATPEVEKKLEEK